MREKRRRLLGLARQFLGLQQLALRPAPPQRGVGVPFVAVVGREMRAVVYSSSSLICSPHPLQFFNEEQVLRRLGRCSRRLDLLPPPLRALLYNI